MKITKLLRRLKTNKQQELFYRKAFLKVYYGTKEVSGIFISENEFFNLNATKKRRKGNLAMVVMESSVSKGSTASLYLRQKNDAGITNGISREQIAVFPIKTSEKH